VYVLFNNEFYTISALFTTQISGNRGLVIRMVL